MVIALLRYAVITAARVLATASAALVGLANFLGVSTEAASTPAGRRRKSDRKQQKQIDSHEPNEDCEFKLRNCDFLKAAGSHYGYGGKLEDLSKVEFSRLRGRVYVDHAGATLYSEKQLRAAYQVSTDNAKEREEGLDILLQALCLLPSYTREHVEKCMCHAGPQHPGVQQPSQRARSLVWRCKRL